MVIGNYLNSKSLQRRCWNRHDCFRFVADGCRRRVVCSNQSLSDAQVAFM